MTIRWGRTLWTVFLGGIALHNFGWLAFILVALASADYKEQSV